MAKLVNIACGDVYVPGWVNFDYAPHSTMVCRANLLERLPVSEASAAFVYSSHFLEHVPRNEVGRVLNEFFRITQSGGRIRLVLPDLEEMCSTYLGHRRGGEHEKADFLMLEMLDQCVRMVPRGELGRFYLELRQSPGSNEMVKYVRERTGHVVSDEERSSFAGGCKGVWQNWKALPGRLERLYCRALIKMLPSAMRQQNVSLATIGERHAWIYDFHSARQLLNRAGFVDVERMTASTSGFQDFPFHPLDLAADRTPRKGKESMYIEALKP